MYLIEDKKKGMKFEMDLTLDVEEYKLNIRAAGIIIHGNKVLAERNMNNDNYHIPGGG